MDRLAKRNGGSSILGTVASTPKGYGVHRKTESVSGDNGPGASYTSSSGNEGAGAKALAIKKSHRAAPSSELSAATADLPSSAPGSSTVTAFGVHRQVLEHHASPGFSSLTAKLGSATTRVKYREQGVDELLQLKLHQAIAATDDVPKGSTIVLATGDGNVGQFNEDGFIGM
jgi:hypothetical protein